MDQLKLPLRLLQTATNVSQLVFRHGDRYEYVVGWNAQMGRNVMPLIIQAKIDSAVCVVCLIGTQ